VQTNHPHRATYGAGNASTIDGFFGIVVCSIENLNLPVQTVIDVQKNSRYITDNPKIEVSFKISAR
jgi:hypothetical protein